MKTVIQTYKMMFGRNPLTAALLLIFWMIIFRAESCHRSEYLSIQNECCPMCPPGSRVRMDCTEFITTSCQPCYEGTYMSQLNGLRKCFTCANCDAGSGLKLHTACTTTSDTVCEPQEGFYCLDSTGSGCVTAREHTRCKPGQYINQNGTALTDTVCSECSNGTYSDGTLTSCRTHTQCGPLEIKPGTASTDAECGEQSSNTMTVVGVVCAVVGIVVVLFLGAAVFVFYHRKKKIKEDIKSITDVVRMEHQPETDPLRTTDGDQQQWMCVMCTNARGCAGGRISPTHWSVVSNRSAGGTLKTALIQATPSLPCPSWIITRCDVCLLQEVRDSKGRALPQLLTHLNRYDNEHVYEAVASERLGRTESYQEQYVFVYRTGTVTVTDQYQYPDDQPGDVDAFAREPFVVRFKAPKTAIKEFVLIPQHTTPTNTTKELDALYDVLQHVKKMWKTEALEVSDHYPVEVLLKEVKSSPNSGASLSLPGTKDIANQKTKFFSLFVLSHLFFQMLTC